MDKLTWFGHASFMLKDENARKLLFLDPFELKAVKEKADIIFITHAHYDHWSLKDIKKIWKEDTKIIATNGCTGNFPNMQVVEPNKEFSIEGIKVKTIPAYNIKPERLSFHPRKNNWVGYILTIDDKSIYHAGDTDFIPEMKNLKNIHIALLPIGGTYTMDVDEAVQAANIIKAHATIPIHYRRLLGEKYREAEEKLRKGVKGNVEILEEIS